MLIDGFVKALLAGERIDAELLVHGMHPIVHGAQQAVAAELHQQAVQPGVLVDVASQVVLGVGALQLGQAGHQLFHARGGQVVPQAADGVVFK